MNFHGSPSFFYIYMIIIPILFIVCIGVTAYSIVILLEFLDRTLEIMPPEPYLFLLRVFLFSLVGILSPLTLIYLLFKMCYLLVKNFSKFKEIMFYNIKRACKDE